jgi:gliding motility-associated-like protein
MLRRLIYLIACTCSSLPITAQYLTTGSAFSQNCHCHTITPAQNTQNGSVWNIHSINLTQNFDIAFDIFLGCADGNGADGIAFVLQPLPTALGLSGGGMGYEGITPSLGVVIDTYQNTAVGDPAYDHISIHQNGDISHNTANNLAGPVQVIFGNDNVEDCAWHLFRITWDATAKVVSTYIGGALRTQANVDLVNNVFSGNPVVYWGLTGSTGLLNNEQKFCARLNSGFASNLLGDSTCAGSPVPFTPFIDALVPVIEYYWNFGDGTTSTLRVPPPHTYALPGEYLVKMVIKGADGCVSDTFEKPIFILSPPVVNFTIPPQVCENVPFRPQVNIISSVTQVTNYNWFVDGNLYISSPIPDPPIVLTAGMRRVELVVDSRTTGCSSAPVSKFINVLPGPSALVFVIDGCVGQPLDISGVDFGGLPAITQWEWTFSNGATATGQQPPAVVFNQPGSNYSGKLVVAGSNGCKGDTVSFFFGIEQATANAGNDTVVIANQPFVLNGSGRGDNYSWSPAYGLNSTNVPRPTGTLDKDTTYLLTVTTANGCVATDAVRVTVFKGAQIFLPSAFTPNRDGVNDVLKPAFIGIKQVNLFNIYNRWGQLVYSTKEANAGWDGRWQSQLQPAGNYVYVIRATDFVGKTIQKKGYFILIK